MVDIQNDDPLGLGLKGRARERRLTASLQGLMPVGGPLADPNWDAYLQAMDEQGVDRLQGGASAPGSNQIQGFSPEQTVQRGGFSQAGSGSSLQGLQQIVKPRKVSKQRAEADAYYQQKYPGID